MLTDHLIKLGLSVLVGGLIGLEREYQYKAAGERHSGNALAGLRALQVMAFIAAPVHCGGARLDKDDTVGRHEAQLRELASEEKRGNICVLDPKGKNPIIAVIRNYVYR